MKKRSFLKFAALAVLAGSIGLGSAQAQSVIKIGAVAPKTGPLAGGSAVTHWPNIKLWIHFWIKANKRVNEFVPFIRHFPTNTQKRRDYLTRYFKSETAGQR